MSIFIKKMNDRDSWKLPDNRLYGYAYRRIDTRQIVFAPIPFNWMIGLARMLYYKMAWGPSHKHSDKAMAEVRSMRMDIWNEAYRKGVEDSMAVYGPDRIKKDA